MRIQLIALTFAALSASALAVGAAPLAAQVTTRQDPRDRRPTSGGGGSGTIGDIIFGSTRADTSGCRVRDAITPDGRVVQICDNRRSRRSDDDDDDRGERGERGAKGTRHVNDRDGDGDFDADDRALRKREHELAKAQKRRAKAARKDD